MFRRTSVGSSGDCVGVVSRCMVSISRGGKKRRLYWSYYVRGPRLKRILFLPGLDWKKG